MAQNNLNNPMSSFIIARDSSHSASPICIFIDHPDGYSVQNCLISNSKSQIIQAIDEGIIASQEGQIVRATFSVNQAGADAYKI